MIVRAALKRNQGFSMLEMVIVLGIIGLILAAAVKYATGIQETSRYVATEGKMNEIMSKIEAYRQLAGRYPTEEQGLAALVMRPSNGPTPKRWVQQHDNIPTDAWDQNLVYRFPSSSQRLKYELISLGPDGELDTKDDVSSLDPR